MKIEIKNLKPRAYQQAILETSKNKNTLVVLPTGMGKTACALLLAAERLNKFPTSKVLFLAPTKPLATQHHNYFIKHISGLDSEFFSLLTGQVKPSKRERIWDSATFIFSTPQTIANDIRTGRYNLHNTALLIQDECHRCLKNYDYTHIAKTYKQQAENSLLLGLTASPGSEPKIIKQICKNLSIKAVEVRTRESPDVKPYIKKLETQILKVALPPIFKEIRELLAEVYNKRINELRKRKVIFEKQRATKKTLLDTQAKLRRMINTGNIHFNVLRGISILAETIKIQYAIELLETQTISSLHKYLNNMFNEAEKSEVKAVKRLVKNPSIILAYEKTKALYKEKKEHPKLSILKDTLKTKIKQNPKTKAIVFSNYRDMATKINKELKAQKIKSKIFVGQAKKAGTGLTQKEQQQILNEFETGKLNVLIATSIGEEGLDIAEVGTVIFYEPIPSAIRKIQRTGRTARLRPGELIILMTKGTRDESYHYAARYKEKKMYGVLEDLKKQFGKKEKKQASLEKFM